MPELPEPSGADRVRAAAVYFVLAPVLCSYILHVLQDAVRTGKKRLYFLARDGFQMHRIAKILCRRLGLPLECRYLYCSRYALRAAEYAVREETTLDYLCLGGMEVTPETVFRRAGITQQEEICRMTELFGLGNAKKPLSRPELRELRTRLAASTEFTEQLKERAGEAFPAAVGYLRQEGMLENIPWALVDSGWSGSIQQSFRHLLSSAGRTGRVEGYYFGLYEYPVGADRSTYHTWYFSPVNGLRRKAVFNNNLFECVCSSPEGMTTGYRFEGGGGGTACQLKAVCGKKACAAEKSCAENGSARETSYAPQLACRANPNAARAEELAACFTGYAEALAKRLSRPEYRHDLFAAGLCKNKEQADRCTAAGLQEKKHGKKPGRRRNSGQLRESRLLKISEQLLSLLMGSPTPEEAGDFGSYVFCDDVLGEEDQRLAAVLSSSDIRANRLSARLMGKYMRADMAGKESAWLEASAVLASGYSRRILRRCRRLRLARCARKQIKALLRGSAEKTGK